MARATAQALPAATSRKQYEHAFDYRLLDYDDDSINSFASFGRSFDLFGDGSVTLVSTPGHSAAATSR